MKCAMGAVLFCAAVGALFLSGCGDDEETLTCEYCEHWNLLLDGLARHPAFSPDPNHPDRIAFSSKRSDANSVVEEDRYEHIWVKDGDNLYKITSADYDDFQPSWSPDGTRIAFTRQLDGRFDLWVVDVASLASPGLPVRLTSEANVDAGASESSWQESEGHVWVVFASGGDIYRIHNSGGTPTKLIPDPLDVAGRCGYPEFPDLQPAVGPGGRVAFTSVGRGEVGNVDVSGYFEQVIGGETTEVEVTDAEIYLDDCNTGFTAPHSFVFLPVRPDQGSYTVGVESPAHCNRRDISPVVRPNQTTSLRFNFFPTAGDVYLWVYEANCNIYDIFEGDTTFHFRMGTGFPEPADSTLKCLEPGNHVILIEWNSFSRDTTVSITAGETEMLYVFQAKDGSNAPMRPYAGVGDPPVGLAPQQSMYEAIWIADLENHKMVGFWSMSSQFEQATWSPTGQYVAFVASDLVRNVWGVRIADVDGESSSIWSVPLPGSSGSASCMRSAYHLSWNSSGDRLAVAMGDCQGASGPQDLQIWIVDPRPFLGK